MVIFPSPAFVSRMALALVAMAVCGWIVNGRAEEPITPIGSLLVNPSAFHRKLLKLEGTAKEVRPYSKFELTSVCGANFKLVDETGTIDIIYQLRCQYGGEQDPSVSEGTRVIVEGSMEAPSSVVRNQDGKENEFGIYALSVKPVAK